MKFNLILAGMNSGAVVGLVILALLIIGLLILIASSFKIVPQAQAYVIEKLGSYHTTWETGFHFLVPFIYRIAKKVNLKEQVFDFDPQPVITKDNVTMQIDTVVFFYITDPKLYTYGVEKPLFAIEKLTATTLRNIIGEIDLDGTLTSRDVINSKVRAIIDDATDPWGIKVTRVELKDILPPKDIRDAMEKQMRAERQRRESILRAEGEKRAAILEAEGFKESEILRAEAVKQAAILQAEGEAQSILEIQNATAEGIKKIKEAGADTAVLTLKAYDALVDMSKGQATKIIVPSDISKVAGLTTSITEIIKGTEEPKK